MPSLYTIGLLTSGVLNTLPAVGVFGEKMLTKLYGIPFKDPNLILLMRHRAVLFGMVGSFMLYAIWKPEWRQLARMAGLSSMLSFVVLAVFVGPLNKEIRRVVNVDIVASVFLIGSMAVEYLFE